MTSYFPPRALPASLEALTELALDLRWTWNHAGDAVWRNIDPELWERTRNPWAILQNTPQLSLENLARDPVFQEALRHTTTERQRYLSETGSCTQTCRDAGIGSVAYLSMEFGLSEAFPLYAGGLGILAGDCLKTASDLGVPLVGVGLLYQEGYFRQVLDASDRQQEAYPYNDPTSLPIQPVIGPAGEWLRVGLEFPGRTVHFRVWQASVGRVRLYLLDSNDLLNGPADRGITAKLYGDGGEMRLMQEIALGIGGWRMLEALGIKAEVCHLNEGHAAFAVLERARHFMLKAGVTYQEALWATRAGNVFTTHTPVDAGFDRFSPGLVLQYFRDYAQSLELPFDDLLALGRRNARDDREPFNMAYLALRGCAAANAVSRLHGEVSRHLFADLYPGWPVREVPVSHVTNGVHVPSWDSLWADRLWSQVCGKERWLSSLESLPEAIRSVDDKTLWELTLQKRRDLVHYARERLAWQLGQRGAAPGQIAETAHALDVNVLTLGFARRFSEYKRPNLLLKDPERLARLLLNSRRPVQIIVAGKAHPEDAEGKRLLHAWLAFVNRPDVRTRAVFIEDYDMAVAQEMVQGVDLWINTPRPPWEACGTSGMKVLANGGLNMSTIDGWWAEAYSPEVGWAIDGSFDGHPCGDEADAERLYRLLEEDAVPLFYDRDAHGIPRGWVQRMRTSISSLAAAFSSNRMLQDYLERFYCPGAAAFRRRSARDGALAKELHAWHGDLAAGWGKIHFGEPKVERQDDEWHYDVPVYLAEISPESVKVELYAEPEPGQEPVRRLMTRGPSISGAMNGYMYRTRVPASRPAWHFTLRIVTWHPEALTPIESGLILWQR